MMGPANPNNAILELEGSWEYTEPVTLLVINL